MPDIVAADRRKQFLGSPVDVLTHRETVELIDQAITSRRQLRHVALNVAKIVKMQTDAELRQDVESADIIGIDGMGVVLGMRLMGHKVDERVAGIDLMDSVLALCAARGYRPYFLGAKIDVVQLAAERVMRRHPTLAFAGIHHGYFSSADENAIVADVENSQADCLFIGMPTPAKERFLARHAPDLSIPYVMGVGGSFDVLAGVVQRAPEWVSSAGFEWLYRTLQEPRRMWRRYAVTNSQFAIMLGRALFEHHVLKGRSRKSPTS